MPIDLRQPGDVELGNRFGIIAVELPVGIEHPLERLMTVRQRMLALKTSYEPATTLGLFAALGYLPKVVQDQLFNLLLSRATAVMTNVPGPSESLSVAGSVLKQSLFWVPQTGDVGMGVSILSYAGKVQFGLITDAALTPDPEAIVSRFAEEFEQYLYYTLLDPRRRLARGRRRRSRLGQAAQRRARPNPSPACRATPRPSPLFLRVLRVELLHRVGGRATRGFLVEFLGLGEPRLAEQHDEAVRLLDAGDRRSSGRSLRASAKCLTASSLLAPYVRPASMPPTLLTISA